MVNFEAFPGLRALEEAGYPITLGEDGVPEVVVDDDDSVLEIKRLLPDGTTVEIAGGRYRLGRLKEPDVA